MPDNEFGIFVRHPVAGGVKTRLAAGLGAEAAAALYAAFVGDLADRFRRPGARSTLCYAPAADEAASYFAELAGNDYALWPQPDGSLGERLRAFFDRAFAEGARRAVVIGSDSPTLPRRFVEQAFDLLSSHDCVVCPAFDGGYCLIGMRDRTRPLFEEIDWSTPRVLKQTLARVEACGASLALLPPWYDVDTPADLARLRADLRELPQGAGDVEPLRTARMLRNIASNSADA